VDNFATFCKMTVFERAGDRHCSAEFRNWRYFRRFVSILKQHAKRHLRANLAFGARAPCFDVANIVSDAVRSIERRDGRYVAERGSPFNASFIIGGQD